MGKKHVNGDDPYVMTVAEARDAIDEWTSHGGQVRTDGPHPGKNDEVHAHFYTDNNPSQDLLIQIIPSEEELASYESASESDDDGDDDNNEDGDEDDE